MSGFRPPLLPTLFTLAVVAICTGLGVWQLQRLQWKRDLIAQRAAALAAPPVGLPRSGTDAGALEFHRVVAEGVYLHDKELFLNAIGARGAAGFEVLTPLRAADGRTVFVDRGFVPSELRNPAMRRAGQPAGPVRVVGRLRVPALAKPGWFVPDNRADSNLWFWIDLKAMAAADGVADPAPFYIEADTGPNPGGWPQGRAHLPELPNDHLQYAMTWFALAAAALVVFVLSQRRKPGTEN